MAKGTLTNLQELEAHITQKFKGMMKSKEMAEAGKQAGQAIGRYVGDEAVGGGDSGYNYNQSGAFHKLIMEEAKGPTIVQKPSKIEIGVFEWHNMSDKSSIYAMRNHQVQIHEVWDSKQGKIVRKPISLKGENQMPKWILAEFGSGKFAESVPAQFKINYTKRDKPYMYGRSIGPVRGIGGGDKSGHFMVSNNTLLNLLGPNRSKDLNSHRTHQGIRAGHIFSIGLRRSKSEVQEILGHGIQNYLNNG